MVVCGPPPAGVLAVLGPRPAAGPALTFLQLLLGPPDARSWFASELVIEVAGFLNLLLGGCGVLSQEVCLMQESRRSRRRVLSPEEQWEMFLEVTSQDLTQADVARKWEVDVSVVIRIRRQVKDAALEACEFTVVFGVTEPRLDRCLTFSVDLTTEIGL
jgi:hypothetical protein